MITIPAVVGDPYEIGLTDSGLIRLVRGKSQRVIMSPADALKVADAIVDTVEQL